MEFDFKQLIEKIKDLEFDDIFPLHRRDRDVRNLLINVGIYMGLIVAAAMLLVFLGDITVLGVILKIICIPAIIYALVGMFADLLRFLKYN